MNTFHVHNYNKCWLKTSCLFYSFRCNNLCRLLIVTYVFRLQKFFNFQQKKRKVDGFFIVKKTNFLKCRRNASASFLTTFYRFFIGPYLGGGDRCRWNCLKHNPKNSENFLASKKGLHWQVNKKHLMFLGTLQRVTSILLKQTQKQIEVLFRLFPSYDMRPAIQNLLLCGTRMITVHLTVPF